MHGVRRTIGPVPSISTISAIIRNVTENLGSQAISYTTGVPAMVGAMMMLTGKWMKPGVWNMEQMDPDPFLEQLARYGLPWVVSEITEEK